MSSESLKQAMVLRSGRLLIKKPKNEIKKQHQEEEDLISRLPDEILLTRILSVLPDADAYRTSILSNRWKDLRAFLPNLHFVMPNCQSRKQALEFHDLVDKTLACRGGMPIQRFFLQGSNQCSYKRAMNTIRTVVESEVEELHLTLPSDIYKVSLCWDLFKTCYTLVALTLKGNFILDVPESGLLFPCLKKLDLVSIVYFGRDRSFENLISGCPHLEELFVERNVLYDKLHKIKFSSPSLKRLRLEFTSYCEWDILFRSEIDAPKVEYLYIQNERTTFNFKKMLYLDESHLCIDGFSPELFTSISSTKTLELTYQTMTALTRVHDINMPIFPNLVRLVVSISSPRECDLLLTLLNSMPNLEHITFLHVLMRRYYNNNINWHPPHVAPPACMSFMMKEIIILDLHVLRPDELFFIKYLLEHSLNLETFRVKANINYEMREQLLNFHRGSRLCRVEFL